MKQTAVEWFQEQFNKYYAFSKEEMQTFDWMFNEAKEMEKEQMIEFAKYTSRIDTDKSDMNKVIDFYLTLDGEEFVEETFKSE